MPIDRNDAPRLRSVTTRSGSSGLRLRDWIPANAASSTTPVTRNPIVVWLPQLVVCACEKPYTSENRPADTVSTPGMSSLGLTAGRLVVQQGQRAGDRDRREHEVDVHAVAPAERTA